MLETHRGELESRALLVQHIPTTPRTSCNIDAEQLAQAFTNALLNAVEAAAEGSDLTIKSVAGPDGIWESRLHNDGPAVAPDVLAHVFEPLVSAKLGHSGIGLAITHRILNDHAGSVSIDSSEGKGTTLTFTLPTTHVP